MYMEVVIVKYVLIREAPLQVLNILQLLEDCCILQYKACTIKKDSKVLCRLPTQWQFLFA